MAIFDYDAPAELFASPRHGFGKHAIKYRRFATSVEAIVLEVCEERFEAAEIRELYYNTRYPLARNSD